MKTSRQARTKHSEISKLRLQKKYFSREKEKSHFELLRQFVWRTTITFDNNFLLLVFVSWLTCNIASRTLSRGRKELLLLWYWQRNWNFIWRALPRVKQGYCNSHWGNYKTLQKFRGIFGRASVSWNTLHLSVKIKLYYITSVISGVSKWLIFCSLGE